MTEDNSLNERIHRVETQISTHEAVCAERYQNILATSSDLKQSLKIINGQMLSVGLLLLCGMAGILGQMVFFSE